MDVSGTRGFKGVVGWRGAPSASRSGGGRAGRLVNDAGSVLAIALVLGMAGAMMAGQADGDRETVVGSPSGTPGRVTADDVASETVVSGYLGSPYTYPSDIKIKNPAEKTDVTVVHAGWDAKPFKHPIYYGVRVIRWGASRTGMMVDFTHAKTITRPEEEVLVKGLIGGADAPERARIGALFKHMEFSHGHNLLTLNGLLRLAAIVPRVTPYVGLGAGVCLPHTEVQMTAEPSRTYEYQYTGPVVQMIAGVELRLPRRSVFLEYKFSWADYTVPLSRLEGGVLFSDLWRQFKLWWAGEPPPGGTLTTYLLSHHIVGGAGVRVRWPVR